MKITFGSVTPIRASDHIILNKLMNDLGKESNSNPYCICSVTHLYEARKEEGVLTNAAKRGDEIGLLLTGKEYRDYKNETNGWTNGAEPTRHINKPVLHVTFDSEAQYRYSLKIIKKRIEAEKKDALGQK